MSPIETFVGLLAAVAALTWLAQRIHVEYPIFLVIGGLVLGFVPELPAFAMQPDVVFLLFLPPLLYYEAFNTSLGDYKPVLRLIVLNAVFLVVVTIAAVAAVAHALIAGMTWAAAIVLGSIVGPTDETAAIAIASRLRVPRKLVTLVKAESLFNDATSLVIYNIALVAAVTGTFSWASGFFQLVVDAVGGVVVGLAVGWVVGIIRRQLDDLSLQNTVSLLTGYAAYYPADALHVSGVLAAITAGLYLGRQGHAFTSPAQRVQIGAMRDITLFLINGTLFVLVGLQLHPIVAQLLGVAPLGHFIALGAAVSLVVIVVRIVWMFPSTYFAWALSGAMRRHEQRPPPKDIAVLSWTGLRGGISLAAALAVPLTTASGAPFPERALILFLTFAVIFSTLVGQGLTLPALIRVLHVHAESSAREEALARLKASRAAYAALNRLAGERWAHPVLVDDFREHLKRAMEHHRARRDRTLTPEQERLADSAQRIARVLNDAQAREIVRLRDAGAINDETMRKIRHELDLEAIRNDA